MSKETLKKISFFFLYAILVLLIFLLLTYFILEERFNNQIYPNVYFAGVDLSGLSRDEAQDLIEKKVAQFEDKGVKIKLKEQEMTWYNLASSFDPDLAFTPVLYNISTSSNQAYLIARDGTWLEVFHKIRTLFFDTNLTLDFSSNPEELKKMVQENFSSLENPSQDAALVFKEEYVNGEKKIIFSTTGESDGYEIDYNLFLADFSDRLSNLDNSDINLKLVETKAKIHLSDISSLPKQAEEIANLAPFELKSIEKKKTFNISRLEFASWLKVSDDLKIGLDKEKVTKFFDENIAKQINQEALQPKIELNGDRVSIFEPGRDGLILDYEASILAIEEAVAKKDLTNISLVTKVETIEKVSQANDLGIFELIGSGHSNFAGSPANRRHNIRTGASKLHGLIIKPGEEFSLVGSLGKVDGSTGYLQELVIKDNKTIPEYGGGLCQIATTMFRAALGTGLPITERRNHSYRVSYYEPAGTDATIYMPRPDLKFRNDTGNNILIQARFEGYNDIYFDFWGKSDGRTATTTYPVIYNIVKPGPTQIIETTDLKPGEKKCTEKAHSGADAYFDYTVIYNQGKENENKVETRFSSKYVPWREVCLVGVEPKTETASSTATSTESISSSTGQLN